MPSARPASPPVRDQQHRLVGQLIEWAVWSQLTAQALGELHVFLPLDDRGIDGVVKHVEGDLRVPVQVKGRTTLSRGFLHIVDWDSAFADDSALLIAVGFDVATLQLHPWVCVVDVGTFKKLGDSVQHAGRTLRSAEIPLPPRQRGRWSRYCLPLHDLGARFFDHLGEVQPAVRRARPRAAGLRLGYLAETEVIRRMAALEELNLFKSMPDIETDEYVLRHVESHRILGIQVKSVSVDAAHPHGTVDIHRRSLRVSPHTWFLVLAEMRGRTEFHEECLLIPSVEIERIAERSGDHLGLVYRPGGSRKRSVVDQYRVPLSEAGPRIEVMLRAAV